MAYRGDYTLFFRIWSVIALEKKAPQINIWDVELWIERLCRHLDPGLSCQRLGLEIWLGDSVYSYQVLI